MRRPGREVSDTHARTHVEAPRALHRLRHAHDAPVEEVNLRALQGVALALAHVVLDEARFLGLGNVLRRVVHERRAGAALDVHRGAPREEPFGHVRAQPLVLLADRPVLVSICLRVDLCVRSWARDCELVVAPQAPGIPILAALRGPVSVPRALGPAVVALDVPHELAPLPFGRRVAVPWGGRDDALLLDRLPVHPDADMNVERATRLVFLPPPHALDLADGRVALEVRLEEELPSMVVLARGLDRPLRVMLAPARGFEIRPASLVAREGSPVGGRVELHGHRDELGARLGPVRLAAHDLLSDRARVGLLRGAVWHVLGRRALELLPLLP